MTMLLVGTLVGAIYGLVAVGFVLIYKCSGIFNFAQGELFLLGAYVTWAFVMQLGLPIWLSLVLSVGVGAIVGLLIERLALRPLLGQNVLILVMATLALAQIFQGTVVAIWGGTPKDYVAIFPPGEVSVGNINIPAEYLYGFVITTVIVIAITLFLRMSRIGLAMRAIADGHQVVRSMGINITTIIGITWAIAAMIAVIGGSLMSTIQGTSLPLGHIGLRAIPAAFIGGLDSIHGAIVGGIIIGVMEMLISGYLGMAAGTPMAFLLLVFIMFFRPQGLFGSEAIERV